MTEDQETTGQVIDVRETRTYGFETVDLYINVNGVLRYFVWNLHRGVNPTIGETITMKHRDRSVISWQRVDC